MTMSRRRLKMSDRLRKAAQTYFDRYCQDEADSAEYTGCSEQQHLDAVELQQALAAPPADQGEWLKRAEWLMDQYASRAAIATVAAMEGRSNDSWRDGHERSELLTHLASRPAGGEPVCPVAPFAEGGLGHALHKIASAYLDDYEYDDGDSATFPPNEYEQAMLTDFLEGVFAEPEFSSLIGKANECVYQAGRLVAAHPPAVAGEPGQDLRAENERLRAALQTSMTAIDDWLNLFASDHCDERRVKEAQERVHANGTIYYIATVQAANRAALAASPVEQQP
jgi:hypothetical protein